jgi:DNA replication protein DnaC
MNPDIKQDLSTLITQIDFLVIDELDSVQSDIHPSVQSLLTSLLKKRSYSNKPLIVTATTPRDGIKYTLGTTIYSTFSERLSEIVFVGDYRKQLRQNLEDKYFNNGN